MCRQGKFLEIPYVDIFLRKVFLRTLKRGLREIWRLKKGLQLNIPSLIPFNGILGSINATSRFCINSLIKFSNEWLM